MESLKGRAREPDLAVSIDALDGLAVEFVLALEVSLPP